MKKILYKKDGIKAKKNTFSLASDIDAESF